MTKKDYIAFAKDFQMIKKLISAKPMSNNQLLDEIIKQLSYTFLIDNPRFNKQKFLDYINK